jgi:hypothetical protein
MNARTALGAGFRAARSRRGLVLALFGANLAWALLWTAPFGALFARVTAYRPYADALGQGLKLPVLAEILSRHPEIVTVAGVGALIGTVGWAILSWFLYAGTLALLTSTETERPAQRFAVGAVQYAWAMARLALFALAPYAAALVVGALASAALGAGVGGVLGYQAGRVAFVLGLLPGAFLWIAAGAAADLARARLFVHPAPPTMRSAMMAAIRDVARHAGFVVGVELGGVAVAALASVVYLALAWPGQYASGLAFLLLLVLRQGLVLFRTGVRVATLAAMVEVARELPPPALRHALPFGGHAPEPPPPEPYTA